MLELLYLPRGVLLTNGTAGTAESAAVQNLEDWLRCPSDECAGFALEPDRAYSPVQP